MRLFAPLLVLALLTSACRRDPSDSDTDVDADTDTDVDTDTDTDTDTDPPGPDTFLDDCGVVFEPPADGALCTVEAGEGPGFAIRGTVLGPERASVGGTLVVDADGEVVCAGCDCTIPDGITVMTCADGVISPGLIDPHDHITFTDRAPFRFGDRRWDHRHGWRGELSTPGNRWGNDSVRWGEIRKVFGGTTSLVGSGGTEGFVRNLDRNNLAESSSLPFVDYDTFPLGDSNRQFRSECRWNYAIEAWDVAGLDAYVPHVAEGIDTYAAEEFVCLSDPMEGGEDVTEANTAHIHAIGLQAADYDQMARDGASLIWSPRSNLQLYGETARVTTFAALGGNLALGSDWTYSGSIHPIREMACADAFNRDHLGGYFSSRQIWQMATRNAAIAVGAEGRLGALVPGALGDVAIFAGAAEAGAEPWRAVIDAGATDVHLVVRGGEPLMGDPALVEALGRTCEALDVCGASRALCANQEIGQSYAALQGRVSGAYPAFFCDLPTDEPVCSAARPGRWPGVASDGDADGDGVPDETDLCPSVFDPIRPIDDGAQRDADGDGLGDACDPDPLPIDLDGDGFANDDDNCPYRPNADQDDADADGKGDACDPCPELPNPDTVCPPAAAESVRVDALRDGSVALGSRVFVRGLQVTAVWSSGFYAQDPNVRPSNAGIAVFVGRAPGVTVGQQVEVTGELQEYFGELQIAAESFEARAGGSTIEPVDVTLEQAASEAYEGMLVRVDGAVTNLNYDCSVDGSACRDAGLWEVGGRSGVVVFDRAYAGSDWTARKGQLPVAGVMTFRFERRRLMPRTAADFGE